MTIPARPKIYHIVHVDRLPSIVSDGGLLCDADIAKRSPPGTEIGISHIKQRRHGKFLSSHPKLSVGSCVPFYFCPRSVMLYLIHQANHPDLSYRGGQDPIAHLEFDLKSVVEWADTSNMRWAFTLSNAGSGFFDDRCDLAQLDEIDWNAVNARDWRGHKEGKQAEFLVESRVPWGLVERIGVSVKATYQRAAGSITAACHKPKLDVIHDWYC